MTGYERAERGGLGDSGAEDERGGNRRKKV